MRATTEKELLKDHPEMPKGVAIGFISTDTGWRLQLRINPQAIEGGEEGVEDVRAKLLELLGELNVSGDIKVVSYIRRE